VCGRVSVFLFPRSDDFMTPDSCLKTFWGFILHIGTRNQANECTQGGDMGLGQDCMTDKRGRRMNPHRCWLHSRAGFIPPGVPVSNIGPNPFVLLFDGSIHGGIKHGVSVRGICRRFIIYTYSHGPPNKQAGASSPCRTKFARLPRFIMDPTG